MAKSDKPRTQQGRLLRECTLRIVNGIVKSYFPAIGLYIVTLEGHPARCCSLNYSGGLGMGLYAKGTYSPGDSVFCIYHEALQEGFIIGSMPRNFIGRQINYPMSGESTLGLTQPGTARAGILAGPVSGCTNDDDPFITQDTECNVIDSYSGGSFSMSSETGIRFFADPYSMGMQCDDATGLWVYSDDSYMRQSSINFQQIAGGKVEEDYNDNGELNETVGHSMFSWELLGQTERPTEDTIKSDPGILQNQPIGSAYFVDENAKPFHRVVEYGGYLGHGYQRVVNAPPKTKPDSYKYGAENPDQYCLSRIAQFADGDVSIESAKSIILTKHCYIPSVQTLQVADDLDGGAGDSSIESGGEYDFSHDNVKIKPSPEFRLADGTCELLQELAALMDYQTYLFNYKLVYPFVYHKKDYYVSDLNDTDLPVPSYKAWFSELRTQQFANTPDEFDLDIHEKLKSTYYASESGLALLPEGGVSLYGGYGEEVRMGAGTTTVSSPGDIWIKAGRNIHLWAGNDIILKAKNCIDESATDGSVRIKAETHLEMLGGNAGSAGGVLIESRSASNFNFSESGDRVENGGLILRASKGTAILEGSDTYICSGIDGGIGTLTLDAGQPNGKLNLCGGSVNNYISTDYFVASGTFDSNENGTITNILHLQPGPNTENPGTLTMSAQVLNTGTIINKSSIFCGGSVIVKNSCATLMGSPSMVLPIDNNNVAEYEQLFDRIDTSLRDKVSKAQESYNTLSEELYSDNKAGNSERIADTSFSYRTEEEYGASDFKLYADRWQNIAYFTDMEINDLPVWEEREVTTINNVGQYPYPGDTFYTDPHKTCLVYQGFNLYNEEVFNTYPRLDDVSEVAKEYAEPKYTKPDIQSLNYYIIVGGAND